MAVIWLPENRFRRPAHRFYSLVLIWITKSTVAPTLAFNYAFRDSQYFDGNNLFSLTVDSNIRNTFFLAKAGFCQPFVFRDKTGNPTIGVWNISSKLLKIAWLSESTFWCFQSVGLSPFLRWCIVSEFKQLIEVFRWKILIKFTFTSLLLHCFAKPLLPRMFDVFGFCPLPPWWTSTYLEIYYMLYNLDIPIRVGHSAKSIQFIW